MTEFETTQPIVIDNGSGMIKAGFAESQQPDAVFPAFVGYPKHKRVMVDSEIPQDGWVVGQKASELRGLLRLTYPARHGVIHDWDGMRRIWDCVYDRLRVKKEEHAVLLTEPPLNPRRNRTQTAETFFEVFGVPALFVQTQAILSLYASGLTTGVVLDSGDGVTHAVPVYDGFALPHAIQRIDVAGRDVTEYLQLLLRKAGYNFHTSAELETVRDIKEKKCYAVYNIDKAESQQEEAEEKLAYTLPDNRVIYIGRERYRAPELLFKPSLVGLEYVGIDECLNNAICKADLDMRRNLYKSIVLAGGSTMFPGFGDRLLWQMKTWSPQGTKIRIMAPPNRHLSTYIGGSILAALSTFKKMWVTKKEYEEVGAQIVLRKTF